MQVNVTRNITQNPEKQIMDRVFQAMVEACGGLTNLIKKDTPFATGRLQDGNDFKAYTEGNEVIGHLYNDVEYSPHVHEGTYKMAARPFMRATVDKNINVIQNYFQDIL